MYYAWFWQTVYFQQFLFRGLRVVYSVNIENYFLYTCYQTRIFHSKYVILIALCLVLTNRQTVSFQNNLLGGLMVIYSIQIENIFHLPLFIFYVILNVKALNKCMYFWVTSIACPNLALLYIHYKTNVFVPVARKRVPGIMLPVRTSWLRESFSVKSLVCSSTLHPRFASPF